MTHMFEFFIGLFVATLLNGVFQHNKDPSDYYWIEGERTENIWQEIDSALIEDVYRFDSIVYFFGDSAVMRTDFADTAANVQPDNLQLDGL